MFSIFLGVSDVFSWEVQALGFPAVSAGDAC